MDKDLEKKEPNIEDLEMTEENFAELKKLAKISATTLLEESKKRAEIEERVDEMQKRTDDLQDTSLRLQADFDNYRKRTQAEIDGLFNEGMADAIKLMLPIMDDLQRALDAALEAEGEGITKGISMCIDKFMDTFAKAGLEEIPAEGEDFDPNLHEAIMQRPCEEEGQAGKVAEVMQKGYKFKDKVLRYSVVQVYSQDA